jgi:hypothetical protein
VRRRADIPNKTDERSGLPIRFAVEPTSDDPFQRGHDRILPASRWHTHCF